MRFFERGPLLMPVQGAEGSGAQVVMAHGPGSTHRNPWYVRMFVTGSTYVFQKVLDVINGNWFLYNSTVDNLTAHAGGGQGSATAITAMTTRFTTVASANDSSVLPASQAGLEITVINAAASNAMNVFPATGEQINALGSNAAFSLAAGKTAIFFCCTAGQWHSILSA